MKILILGMPGSGKGTMSTYLEEYFNCKHISTGDMLRQEIEADTPLGQQVQSILHNGKLVDDLLMGKLVKKTLTHCSDGFILDGYPRTHAQCEFLASFISLSAVVYLELNEEIAINRILHRSQSASVQRADDKEDVIRERFKLFHHNNAPILEFYRARGLLVSFDATPPPAEVRQTLIDYFKTSSKKH